MSLSQNLAAFERRAQAATLSGLLRLPLSVKRKLAGKPVVVDGLILDTETQLVLRLQRLMREPAAESLPIEQGRKALAGQSALVAGRQPIGEVSDPMLGGVPCRVYVPRALLADQRRPTLVYVHGGGFIYGAGHSTHDAVCRFLAEQAGVQVVSVDYRLAPEDPFPAAYDDALAAFRAVVAGAEELRVDADRLAIGGDSAGGNLAAVVAIAAAEEGLPLAFQLLVYPVADLRGGTRSRDLFAEGFFLTREFMDLAEESYLARPGDVTDPRASPLLAELPNGLAPAYVVTAGFDPLRDEGEAYAAKLAEAGVAVEQRREPGLIHGFFNWVGVGTTSRAAVADIAARLAAALRTAA